jgi:2-hydroxychromene-2-carboxylate isomerase/predicted thioesterase
MRSLPAGCRYAHRVLPTREDTAAAAGNTGVEVVATTAIILFFEEVCHLAIKDFYEPGEASVGTKVEVEHLAPAYVGQPLEVSAELLSVSGRRVDFKVEARQADRVVMTGRHQRAVVDLARFLGGDRAAGARPRIDFWFDFHSPWCYLASTRIGDLARRHEAALAWRPLHLAKLMEAVDGRRPLEANPAFVRWYQQDLVDQAALLGLPLAPHPRYPLRPARAQRLALRAAELGKAEALVGPLIKAYWSEAADIEDLATLARFAAAAGIDPETVPAIVADERLKAGLEANLAEAVRTGLFGVPTAVLDGKLFFGNDHLDLLEHWLRRAAAGA